MIPKWGWLVGIVIATLCYELNKGGNGYVSGLATIALCRLLVTRHIKDESEQYRWMAAFFVAFVGILGYGLLLNILWPDRLPPDTGYEPD